MSADRSQPATPRRRERAQRDGDVASSSLLTKAAVFTGAAATCVATAAAAAQELIGLGRATIALAFGSMSWSAALDLARDALVGTSAPLLAVTCVVAIAVRLVQSGGVFAPGRLAPDAARLRPPSGEERTANAVIDVVVALALAVAFVALAPDSVRAVANLRSVDGLSRVLELLALQHLATYAFVLLGAGVVDYAWRRQLLARRLRMTPREVQEEAREQEANPQVRARIRRGE